MKHQLFFELLRTAIGQRKVLSAVPSAKEWEALYGLLSKHTLLGIGYVAIQKLPREQWPPKMLVLKWTSVATAISHQNKTLNEECKSLCEEFRHDGVASVVIKGQSNLENYPEELRWYRTPGDIDLWCEACNGVEIGEVVNGEVVKSEHYGIAGVIEYCKQYERCRGRDIPWHRVLYYHCELKSDNGIAIEPHYRISYLHSPVRNYRLQKWFKGQFDICLQNRCSLGFPVLTSSVNVVYQLVHLYRHVFEGGVGLRQLIDYYFALRVWHNDVMECKDLQSQGMWSEGLGTPVMSAQEVMAVLQSFGMGKFASAVMYVLHKVFENEECILNEECRMKKQRSAAEGKANEEWVLNEECRMKNEEYISSFAPWMICEPNEKEGRKLLEEIMKGGNFGQYDTRDAALKKGGMVKHGVWKLKRVMRLVRSYPEEALWEPVFRVWHLGWRKMQKY